MDQSYTVLARRFRPQTFAEVVGQERIAQTLRNAILDGRVAHAYLFTGARGVGKTSMARIFAKALNCPHAQDAVPCNQCDLCLAIAAGQDVDVSEIDGASNRGIDDIRTLRANVNVRSMRSRYKVYIVDEVHMLTKEAFNALLKTLEEPPPSVKFIFCTTEPGKVPDTILSRCQRFDFGTISTAEITTRLAQLATAEGYTVEPAALALVARRAAGSMRDSQSLFDQLLASGERHLAVADVHHLLGTASDDRLLALAQAMIDQQPGTVLDLLQTALDDGVQLEPLVDQLLGYLRDLMVMAVGSVQVPFLAVDADQTPHVQRQAQAWGLQTIMAALELLGEAKLKLQRSLVGRALVEVALVRIAMLQNLDRLDELVAWLKGSPAPQPARRLEAGSAPSVTQKKTHDSGELTPQPAVSQVGTKPNGLTGSAAAQTTTIPSSTVVSLETETTTEPAAEAPEGTSAAVVMVEHRAGERPGPADFESGAGDTADSGGSESATEPASTRQSVVPEHVSAPFPAGPAAPVRAVVDAGSASKPPAPAPFLSASSPSPALVTIERANSQLHKENESAETAPGSLPAPSDLKEPTTLVFAADAVAAPHLLARLKASFTDIVGTYLSQSTGLATIGPNQLEIVFPEGYDMARRACERPEVVARIEATASQLLSSPVRVSFRLDRLAADVPPAPKVAAPVDRMRITSDPDNPLVREVARVFGVKDWQVKALAKLAEHSTTVE
jgi:DNA polymerase III subunit gamma/tau